MKTTMHEQYRKDRLLVMGLLLGIALVVHVAYTLYIRPEAAAWQVRETANAAANPGYVPGRSILVIMKDPEQ